MIKMLAAIAAGYSAARVLESQAQGVPLGQAFASPFDAVANVRARLASIQAAQAAAAAPVVPPPALTAVKKARKRKGMEGFRIPKRAFRHLRAVR